MTPGDVSAEDSSAPAMGGDVPAEDSSAPATAQPDMPTHAEVVYIAAERDPVLRNRRITQCYHELALAVRRRTGPGANWCSFATWASRQAGVTIRHDDLRTALRARLAVSAEVRAVAGAALAALRAGGAARDTTSLLDDVMHALAADAALERAATAVAAGNLKVFAEIGALFARYLQVADDDAAFAQFLEALRHGDPPEGQRLLREAFECYQAVPHAPPTARAQLLCYANLLVGLHEQTRLQPEIAAAMNAAFDRRAVRERLVAALLPGAWRALRYRAAAIFGRRPPLDDLLDRLLAAVQRELRHLLTANAMTLAFPDETVLLGRDLRARHPPSLATISEPRLAELLRRINPAPDTSTGSGAADWSVLSERMHLIAELFRCRHESEYVFGAPYA
jgi:hypothetical protein